jgi:hypothetical protein
MRSRLSALFAVLMTAGSLHADPPVMTVGKALPAEGLRAGDQFGSAVAVGDGMIAVGAYLSDAGGRDSGAVYVYLFHKSAGEWTFLNSLKGEAGEQLGFDVAIWSEPENGTHKLLVGAPFAQVGGHRCGAAYLYTLDGDGKQKENRKVLASPCAEGDEVGSAVAINGTYAVVGARGVEERTGAVYVFAGEGSPRTLTATPRMAKAEFGQSVALHDGRLVVGAPSPYAGSHSPGAAYLFNLPGSSPAALVPSSMPEEGSAFGYAVAIGDQIVVGAPLAGGKARPGKVFLFGTDRASSLPEGDKAGVAVAADKGLIVVGAMAAPNGGSAYLCHGGLCRPLTPPSTSKVAGFGFGTAIHGETVVVGAFQEKGTGAAYVFEPEAVEPPQVTFHFDKTASIRGKEGETVSVSVVLDTDRVLTEPVTAKLSVNGSGDVAVSPTEIIFPKDSKDRATQAAQVSLVADCLTEGEETFKLVLSDAAGKKIQDRTIKVQDGDNAAGLLSMLPGDPPLITNDSGREEVFQLKLTCQPAAEVRVTLSSTDPAEGKVVSPSSSVLHFFPENWNEFQDVTVRGQQDGDGECTDDPYQITFTLSSADPPYNGFFGPALDFVNEEDKGACISATADEKVCADADGTVLYTFTIESSGSRLEDLAGPELADTLPDQVKVVAATADLGVATVDYVGNSVAWNGAIPAGAKITIEVLAALEPGVNPGTVVEDGDNQFRYAPGGNGPEASFTVGKAEDVCPAP